MHNSPNTEWLDRFELHLREQQYAAKSVKSMRASCARFLGYLEERDISIERVNPDVLRTYFDHSLLLYQQRKKRLPRSRWWRDELNRGLIPLLRLVQGEWPPKAVPASFQQEVSAEYEQWMTTVRGFVPQTIRSRRSLARDFLAWLGERATATFLRDITVTDVDQFLETRGAGLGRVTRYSLAGGCRDFLRYLHMSGLSARDLSATVTAPSLYALESIPSAFSVEEVHAVLNTTRSDRTAKGLRDFAILMLLATYGLRSCEIMRLHLEDIDWRCERLLIRPSKNGLETVLPLMPAVGEALIEYLREGRPKVPTRREIFLCMSAPYRPFKTQTAVYYIVANRTKQAGIQPRGKHGPRAFRHTRAVSLLRSAVPLKSIADILGHVTTRSTTTYLKLATEDLRAVGLEIPSETEVQS